MTTAPDREAALSAYFESYVAAGKPGGIRFAVQHPKATAAAFRTLRAMPITPLSVSDTAEGQLVQSAILERPGRGILRTAVSVLRVPANAEKYTEGSSRQTLRRKTRAALKAGVTWRRIDDLDERVRLLRRADAYERSSARETYRNADADNAHLLDVRLWIGAFGEEGEPLMLSITPVDGEWASLSYFRTFSTDPAASDARYLMSKVLVEYLAGLRVAAVADTVNPMHLQNGLRHFQRMVGFRVERLAVSPVTAESLNRTHPLSDALAGRPK